MLLGDGDGRDVGWGDGIGELVDLVGTGRGRGM